MGTPLACAYATLYYTYHEYEILNNYSDCLLYYKQYIDNIFGIWCPPLTAPTHNINGKLSKEPSTTTASYNGIQKTSP